MKDLWDIQKEFNDKFMKTRGGWPEDDAQRTVATKDFGLHLIKEVTEVFDEISFKMHREAKPSIDRGNILEEIVDCQKFLIGLAQVWGFTAEEFCEEFKRKSMVVEQRFAQEQMIASLRHEPVVIVDIDGVLADFPRTMLAWVGAQVLGRDVGWEVGRDVFEGLTFLDQEAWRVKYRQSGVKADLPVLPGARRLLTALKASGVKVILLTNRPYAEHYRIYPDTLVWLAKNSLQYDAILWARDKGLEAMSRFTNVVWAVDDAPKNIERLTQAGITALQVFPYDRELGTAAFAAVVEAQVGIAGLAGLSAVPGAWRLNQNLASQGGL